MSRLADDPRVDPRIKALMANLPTATQTDVESRDALLAELNRPEAVAEREQMTAVFEMLDNEDDRAVEGPRHQHDRVHVQSGRQHREDPVHPPPER